MKIFISSTTEDLSDYRLAVINALLLSGHKPICMEHHAAGDQVPLKECVKQVSDCNAYVGIFAWRYGFIPPKSKISITESEYREAIMHNIPTLIFLLNESTDLEVKKIYVAKAYITEYGKREILLSVEDRIFNGHKIFYFPFVLRLSPNHFGKQLANFLTLRKAMLEDYQKQLKAAKVSHRFKERVIDLRIESLALIEND